MSMVSSTNKTYHHDIAEILLKVTLNTITPNLIKIWEERLQMAWLIIGWEKTEKGIKSVCIISISCILSVVVCNLSNLP